MKIEVNLSGIFADNEGTEVNDAIKNEIIDTVTERIYSAVQNQIQKIVNEILTTGIKERLHAHLDVILPQLMDHEFTEVTSWGEQKGTYTVRNRLLKALDEMCKYNERGYSSENNAFTNSVKDAVTKRLEEFRKEYYKTIDAHFTEQALKIAQEKLRDRLGIKA